MDFENKIQSIRRKNNCNSESVKCGLHFIKLNRNKAFRRKIQGWKMVSFASFLAIRTKKRSPAK
jgi:hypothetical protein